MLRTRCRTGVMALVFAMLVSQAGVGAANADGCAGATAVPKDGATRDKASRAMLCLINRARARRNLQTVRRSRQLGAAARAHSIDMVRSRYFGHEGPAGDTPRMRVQRTGYAPSHPGGVGEALAWGSLASPKVLMQALMQSPEHRRILLDPAARDIGLGLTLGAPADGAARPSSTLTLVFGE